MHLLIRRFWTGEYQHVLLPGQEVDEALAAVAAFLQERGDVDRNDGRVWFQHPHRRYWYFAHPFDLTGIASAEVRAGDDGVSLVSSVKTWRPLFAAGGMVLLWSFAMTQVVQSTPNLHDLVIAGAWLFLPVPFMAIVVRGLVGLVWRAAMSRALTRSS